MTRPTNQVQAFWEIAAKFKTYGLSEEFSDFVNSLAIARMHRSSPIEHFITWSPDTMIKGIKYAKARRISKEYLYKLVTEAMKIREKWKV